ncbi:MAG: hypothetical protein HY606_14920 [Planctomycetes bacterium]|nr:hypothetical protein [Planctomycetota bacterium]
MDSLRLVHDPELMLSIVDLGLVYDVIIKDSNAVQADLVVKSEVPTDKADSKCELEVRMTLTSPACPYGPMLIEWTKYAAEKVENVKSCEIKIVWDPPWDPRTMATEEVKLQLGLL